MLIDNFRIIINNSINELLTLFKLQTDSVRISNIDNPLFITHLVIEEEEEEEDSKPILKLRPSYENFNGIFAQLLITWEDNMQNFEILLPDPYFKGFTYPIIDGE